jgi:alkyl hydroperoxide reductase subunit F
VISGEDVVGRFANEIEYLEFSREYDKAEKVEKSKKGFKVTTRGSKSHEARTLILATGALGRLLNVPGEKEFMSRELCFSAVSYAPLFIDRQVGVIGDAGLALRATAELARTARKVTLIAPSHGELDLPMGKKALSASNVEVLESFQVEGVLGDTYACKLVISREEERREIEADAFFVEIDLVPQSELVADLMARDAQGRIMVDARNRSSAEGIFAAGDVTDVMSEQVLISIGEGAKATLAAYEYLLQQPGG